MINDLNHYIMRQEKFIPDELCNKLIKNLDKAEFETHQFYNSYTKTYQTASGSQELESTFSDVDGKTELGESLWFAIKKYLEYIEMPWFSSWAGYTQIKINKYTENRKMAIHCDHIHTIFDGELKGVPILSVLGFLNDDYDGGELIMFDDQVCEVKKGDLLIFPSNFLYPHKVNPVTKGVRYSIVSWVY